MRLAKGIATTPWGFRAFVRVKGFPLRAKSFKKTVPIEEIQAWRELERAKLILTREQKTPPAIPVDGTFQSDARRYLEAVTALPTYRERVKHIREWIAVLGDLASDQVTSAAIRTQRDTWLTIGPRTIQRGKTRTLIAKPLAPASVNKRLRALENLWTVLWPGTPNPVRQVPEAREPDPRPLHLERKTLDRIFRQLPAGKTKTRLEVLRWTGLPAKTLMRLTPADVDLKRQRIRLPGRHKGRGTTPVTLPLLPQAVRAFRALQARRAFGAFSTSAMYALFQRAADKAKAGKVTPYQLRHTFGTEFLRKTKDLRATQLALAHSTPKLTERYAQDAIDGALQAAFHKMARRG